MPAPRRQKKQITDNGNEGVPRTNTLSRRGALRALGSATTAAFAGCTTVLEDESRAPIRLGSILSLTGPLQAFGRAQRNGGILPADQVNEADVSLSVQPRVEDGASTLDGRKQVAEELVADGYPMVNGPATTVKPVTEAVLSPAGVVACTPSNSLPGLTTVSDLVFRTIPSDVYQGHVMAEIAADRRGASTLAVSYISGDPYGTTLTKQITTNFENQFEGEVVATASHNPAAESYVAHLEELLASDPDALALVSYPGIAIRLLGDYYREFPVEQTLVLSGGAASPTVAKEVDADLSNVIGTRPAVDGPGKREFTSLMQDAYNAPPGPFAAQTYDASAVLLLANAAAGRNDGDAIANQMQSVASDHGDTVTPGSLVQGVRAAARGDDVNYQGAATAVSFSDDGELSSTPYLVWEFDTSASNPLQPITVVDGSK